MNLTVSGVNFIGFTESKTGENVFHTFSCRLQKENEEVFHQVTEEEIERILSLSEKAAMSYPMVSIQNRRAFLQTIIDLLEENRAILIQQFCKESSLTADRAAIELSRTQTQIRTYLDFISKSEWDNVGREVVNSLYFRKQLFPLGTTVVFGASNFPFAYSTIGGDTASALAAGNPVVYKANPYHAGVSEMIARIILKAAKKNHLPDGIFSMVQGAAYWIGEKLVKDPRVKAVGFTGSVRGGNALLEYGKQRKEPIPIFCEMGSLNPTFIFKDALEDKMDEMVDKLSFAIQNDAGQFCTKPGLIFVEGAKSEEFIRKMAAKFQETKPFPMLHPMIYNAFEKLRTPFSAYRSFYGQQKEVLENYAVSQLVVMSFDEFCQSQEAKEEVFGPFSIIIQCKDSDEMKLGVKQLKGNLTASYWTDRALQEEWMYFFTQKVGRIIHNGVPTGVLVIDSQHHGGNFPSTSDSRFTAVGKDAIYRFMQPVTFQEHKTDAEKDFS